MTAVNAHTLAQAIAAAVQAQGVAYGDGNKPTVEGRRPWIVGWLDPGTHSAHTMRSGDGFSAVLVAHCLGYSPESSRWAVSRLTAALQGLAYATVGGRTVQWPQQLSAQPMQRDDDADPVLYQNTVEWRIRTTP